jgi:ribosomal protein S27AE
MKRSLKDHSGYLIIDHSDSPGIKPEDVPTRLRGSAEIVEKGQKFEADIQFCAHCGTQVILNPKRVRARGYCAKCNHYICDNPICNKTCEPLKALLDKAEHELVQDPERPLILLTDQE